MARTTSVELKGDKTSASKLALTHVDRLLEDFRHNNEFQNLHINVNKVKFFDESGQFIGTINMQTVHGTETVIVDVPEGIVLKKKKQPEKVIEDVAQIVPIIRSIDGTHWVACLSGTFEGPYYHFPNNFELSSDVFNDNIEREIDNDLISVGEAPINNSVNLPELYYIAQTGEVPDYDGDRPEEYMWVDSISYDRDYSYIGYDIWMCGDDGGGFKDSYTGTIQDNTDSYLSVFDGRLNIPEYYRYIDTERDRTYVRFSIWSGGDPITEADVIEASADHPFVMLPEDDFFKDPTTSPLSDGDEQTKSISGTSSSPWSAQYSIRAERSNIANFSACYRTTETSWAEHGKREFLPCAESFPPYVVDPAVETTTYCDYYKIDNLVFSLRNKTGSTSPRFYQRDMRYYNTDSIASVTGIMAARVWEDGQYTRWDYYYVGPNSDNVLATTMFIPEAGSSYHIIPNVPGIDDTITFGGRIFLGLIKYKTEREVTDF